MGNYYTVDSDFANDIRKMKEKQDAIPHYKAKLVELGDIQEQSKCELMLKMKHNLEEIEKQEKNEESKGMIASAGYTGYANKEKYVFPAFYHLFQLKKLSRFVNHLITIRCNNYFDKYENNQSDKFAKRNFPIRHYIRFIEDKWQAITWAIEESQDITKLQLLISFNSFDLTDKETEDKQFTIPSRVNFLSSYENGEKEKFYLSSCNSSGASNKTVDNFVTAGGWWSVKQLSNKTFKLSEWEKGFIEIFKVTDKELKKLNDYNNQYKN